MAISAEIVAPPPVQREVVLRLSEQEAAELMHVLMGELSWGEIQFGLTTIADIYSALENAGIQEA